MVAGRVSDRRLRAAALLALLLQLARDNRPEDDEIAEFAAEWVEKYLPETEGEA